MSFRPDRRQNLASGFDKFKSFKARHSHGGIIPQRAPGPRAPVYAPYAGPPPPAPNQGSSKVVRGIAFVVCAIVVLVGAKWCLSSSDKGAAAAAATDRKGNLMQSNESFSSQELLDQKPPGSYSSPFIKYAGTATVIGSLGALAYYGMSDQHPSPEPDDSEIPKQTKNISISNQDDRNDNRDAPKETGPVEPSLFGLKTAVAGVGLYVIWEGCIHYFGPTYGWVKRFSPIHWLYRRFGTQREEVDSDANPGNASNKRYSELSEKEDTSNKSPLTQNGDSQLSHDSGSNSQAGFVQDRDAESVSPNTSDDNQVIDSKRESSVLAAETEESEHIHQTPVSITDEGHAESHTERDPAVTEPSPHTRERRKHKYLYTGYDKRTSQATKLNREQRSARQDPRSNETAGTSSKRARHNSGDDLRHEKKPMGTRRGATEPRGTSWREWVKKWFYRTIVCGGLAGLVTYFWPQISRTASHQYQQYVGSEPEPEIDYEGMFAWPWAASAKTVPTPEPEQPKTIWSKLSQFQSPTDPDCTGEQCTADHPDHREKTSWKSFNPLAGWSTQPEANFKLNNEKWIQTGTTGGKVGQNAKITSENPDYKDYFGQKNSMEKCLVDWDVNVGLTNPDTMKKIESARKAYGNEDWTKAAEKYNKLIPEKDFNPRGIWAEMCVDMNADRKKKK